MPKTRNQLMRSPCSSSRDVLLLHAVWSYNLSGNNISNIKGLIFYHEIRWNLKNAGAAPCGRHQTC
jgi:hypothetical protein